MGNKILLADDSITIQKVIELTFSDEDFEVVTVGNGRLAIERATEVRPDVVLCDIIMPEKDGYEVCAFIKGHDELKHVPVLLLTGAFEPFDQQRAASVGADGYLAKPFEPQTLINKVRELLARTPSRPSAPLTRPVGASGEEHGDTRPSPSATVRVTPQPMPALVPPPALTPRAPVAATPPPAPPAGAGHEVEPFFTAESLAEAEPVDEPVFVPEEIYVDESFEPVEPAAETPTEPTVEPEPVAYEEAPDMFVAPEPPAPAPPAAAPPAPAPESSFDEDFYAEGFTETVPAGFEAPAQDTPPVGSETVAYQPMEGFSFDQEAAEAEPQPAAPEAEETPAPSFAAPEAESSTVEEPAPGAAVPAEPRAAEPEAARERPPQTAAATFEFEMPSVAAPGPPPAEVPEPPPAAAPGPPGEFSFADVSTGEPETAPAPPSQAAEVAVAPDQVAQIAQRVIAQISDKVVREVAWEVIPELAETLLKREIERLREELESLKDE